MKKLLALLLCLPVLFAVGCTKEETAAPPEEPTVPVVEAPKEEAPAKEEPTKPETKTESGFTATKSGLKYKDIKVGTGTEAKAGDKITVHYKGWLDSGKVFDTSRQSGRDPLEFNLGVGQVIKGWDEGVQGMKVGGVRELVIPASLGYGDQDMGDIPPNSTLHFNVELLAVNGKK